jgi:DNA-binding beta-propeller fold protein YncE
VNRTIVKTITFPAGSRPYMLRVTPDGRHVWVQTAAAHTNVVLDADTMEVLETTPAGRGPVASAVSPAGGPHGIVTHTMEPFVLVLDAATGREVTRIDVGGPQTNVSFTPDGATAFVAVTMRDEVVAIDMQTLTVAGRIATAPRPFGLYLLEG